MLEQFAAGHARGSSHGTARIFKLSYPEPEFVRLAQASLVRWRELEAESREELLTLTGSIDCGGLAGRREALEECGAGFEFLDPPEVARRFGLEVDGEAPALYQAEGGVRRATEWAARSFGLSDDTPVRAETCLYTNKPDERFIIERHGRVVVGSPCSGHGFKFAPVIGDRLAELALDAASS